MPSPAEQKGISLCVSIVTYRTDTDLLTAMLASLQDALELAGKHMRLESRIVIIENGLEAERLEAVCEPFRQRIPIELIVNQLNRGYGAAHNQVIRDCRADYQLLMNPDVVMQPDAILKALQYMEREPAVAALSPEVRDLDGDYQYLCKQYPAVIDLALRGFAPGWLKRMFDKRLASYECRTMVEKKITTRVKLISGCFMFCRGETLRSISGFNERFFLYFEDFALSLELGKQGQLVYYPQVSIVHYGGHAAGKGWRHIRYFLRSAWTYYRLYGWKIV